MESKKNPVVGKLLGWASGLLFFAIGVINLFWGNDQGFGVFILLLSLIFFPPISAIIKQKTNRSIHYLVKILIGLFILWAALGVGELSDKIGMMRMDLF